ncbi:MAG: type I glyceraldehyde-3-phosphate dehydrogenase [Coriobacteriales bacterium]|jgi:glyceraldehyde 3-phosphate dehydrogenase|nr:type I glyceraldehyde-3-phosphate dehydrogenase [Coriobacteriales bacterium]
MSIRVGINGFGRIGRLVLAAMVDDDAFEIVAGNDLSKLDTIAHLLKYDSVHGRLFREVEVVDGGLMVNGRFIKALTERDITRLDWAAAGVDLVVEASGKYNDAKAAKAHIDRGARKVLITAPAKHEDITIVMGVNDELYDPALHHIVSNASCTTNCLAPVAKVLLDSFGIKRGLMNTIHAYTGDQRILDGSHKDLRRARAAGMSIVPTTTGAARATALVLPALKGKLDGFATRVPVPDASMVDLTVELERETTKDEVNAVMKAAAEGPLAGIIEYCTDPIVSVDVIGNTHSSVFDSGLTMVLGDKGNFVKTVSWYDNERGYATRVADLAKLMLSQEAGL